MKKCAFEISRQIVVNPGFLNVTQYIEEIDGLTSAQYAKILRDCEQAVNNASDKVGEALRRLGVPYKRVGTKVDADARMVSEGFIFGRRLTAPQGQRIRNEVSRYESLMMKTAGRKAMNRKAMAIIASVADEVRKEYNVKMTPEHATALAKTIRDAKRKYDRQNTLFTDFDWAAVVENFLADNGYDFSRLVTKKTAKTEAVARELTAVARELLGWGGMEHKREFYRPNPARHKNVKQIEVPSDVDLEVWQYEDANGNLYGIAFQGKGQKPLWHYRFRDQNHLNREVQNAIESRREHMKYKQERQQERQQFKHDLKEGTILYSSWGYDQTNINYYQVIEAGEKSVVIREIEQRVVNSTQGADYVEAVPNKFSGPPTTKMVRPGNSVRINSFSSAYVWDGKPKYQTALGYGH